MLYTPRENYDMNVRRCVRRVTDQATYEIHLIEHKEEKAGDMLARQVSEVERL